ncbi:hypothetical protein ACWECC_34255, partial [Streptomyces microflavus]
LALVVVVLATVLLRDRWYWAGGIQALVAVALCNKRLVDSALTRTELRAPKGHRRGAGPWSWAIRSTSPGGR